MGISPDFPVERLSLGAQFLQVFGQIASESVKTVHFGRNFLVRGLVVDINLKLTPISLKFVSVTFFQCVCVCVYIYIIFIILYNIYIYIYIILYYFNDYCI